jgi:hypothetical protein
MKTNKRKKIISTICLALFTLSIMIIPVLNVSASSSSKPIAVGGSGTTNTAQTTLYYNNNASVIEYTILIPMVIQVTGTRSTDMFQIKIDTTTDFLIEPNASVQVAVDKTSDYLVNVSDQVPYTLTSSSNLTTPISNSPLVSFSTASDAPKDVYIYFDPDEADYVGSYGDIMNFTISYVKASAAQQSVQER